MTRSVLILGATSEIGGMVARAFAADGRPLRLAARNAGQLEEMATDLRLRHDVPVTTHVFDALDLAGHARLLDALPDLPEIAVCVIGALGDEAVSQADPGGAAVAVMRANYEAPAAILGAIANRFEARGSGAIVGVSSVAGDRGRGSNYVYGSAKAGFTAYLSGLRNRLARSGVQVLTVKPGFVDTRMTAGMTLPAALTAQPEAVAGAIRAAVARRRDVIYVKARWRPIMLVIRLLPEALFKRTGL